MSLISTITGVGPLSGVQPSEAVVAAAGKDIKPKAKAEKSVALAFRLIPSSRELEVTSADAISGAIKASGAELAVKLTW